MSDATASVSRLVSPKVYMVGRPVIDMDGLAAYLRDSGNEDFLESVAAAREAGGVSDAEVLCSFFAKLCYRALSLGHNANVTRVRDIPQNVVATIAQGHGSVLEHVMFNFVIDKCSRILTHEAVRHRAGTAFSQTSGRFCRLDRIEFVWDPILDGCQDLVEGHLSRTEDLVYLLECRTGLREPPAGVTAAPELTLAMRDTGDVERAAGVRWVPSQRHDFGTRKKITSAVRRVAPNGQSNELGISLNLRALRHTIMVRTAGAAEREIRDSFGQVYRLVRPLLPLAFADARERVVDGLTEVYGMKLQPYEVGYEDTLCGASDEALLAEVARRGLASEVV